MAFGDKLREVLEQRELQQKEFANRINVSKSSINSYVNNHELPNILLVKDMAKELGVSIDYLVEYNPDPDKVTLSPLEAEMMTKFRRLPENKREIIVSLIEMLGEK